MRPFWRGFAAALVVMVVAAATEPLFPALMKPLLDRGFVERSDFPIWWVPAAIIARELNLRLIDTVCCSTYDRMERGAKVETLKGTAAEQERGKGWLIVDDLVDTGVTARAVRAMLPEAHFATVYAKPAGRPTVDSYITEVSQDTWILFPWDQEAVMAKTIIEMKGSQ